MNTEILVERTPDVIDELVDVWESAVRETHLFLTEEGILAIKEYVPQALAEVPFLMIARNDDGKALAFMGIAGNRLEMLFVDNAYRGQGIGKELLQIGFGRGVRELTVNEQNPQAVGFYERYGFKAYKRTDTDEQGDPYPLLYMRVED